MPPTTHPDVRPTWRRCLTVVVPPPALERGVSPDSTGVARAATDLRELVARGVDLPGIVLSPAGERPVRRDRARVCPTRIQARERAARRFRFAMRVETPAREGAIRRDRAGVPATGRELGEGAGRWRVLLIERVVSPAHDRSADLDRAGMRVTDANVGVQIADRYRRRQISPAGDRAVDLERARASSADAQLDDDAGAGGCVRRQRVRRGEWSRRRIRFSAARDAYHDCPCEQGAHLPRRGGEGTCEDRCARERCETVADPLHDGLRRRIGRSLGSPGPLSVMGSTLEIVKPSPMPTRRSTASVGSLSVGSSWPFPPSAQARRCPHDGER